MTACHRSITDRSAIDFSKLHMPIKNVINSAASALAKAVAKPIRADKAGAVFDTATAHGRIGSTPVSSSRGQNTSAVDAFPGKLGHERNRSSSREEAQKFHWDRFVSGQDVKTFTSANEATRRSARAILEGHPQQIQLEHQLLGSMSSSTKEQGSVPVRFARIEDFPQYRELYESKKNTKALVSVGGPAAIDTAVLASLIDDVRDKVGENLYITRDYNESNVAHSASQLHVRHGTALNADPHLTGHRLIWTFLKRNVLGLTAEEVNDSDFRKVDLPFASLSKEKIAIYLGNEFNWAWQALRGQFRDAGVLNEHDLNRLESALSQDVLHLIEQVSGVVLSSSAEVVPENSISIHVDLSASGHKATLHENEELDKRVGVKSSPLSRDEMVATFGPQASAFHGATRYHGDGHLLFEAQRKNLDILAANGGTYLEAQVSKVLFAQDDAGHARLAGMVTTDGQYHYASHGHISLGYKADFGFADSGMSGGLRSMLNMVENALFPAIPGYHVTTATGVSANVIFDLDKNPILKATVDQFGTLPQTAVTNSHWTMIARKGSQMLVRMTGGGMTGRETYNPAYFLNLLANTERIFGKEIVTDVLSTYGCPRSVNARNSTEFFHAANLLVSYGKGGTGNTKRHAEAAMALSTLDPDFKAAARQFLDEFANKSGQPLGQVVENVHQQAVAMGFIQEGQSHFDRRLGYDHSLSEAEVVGISMMLVALTIGAAFALDKPSDDDGAGAELTDTATSISMSR